MKRLQQKLYHISEENLDGKLLTPRVPYNFFTQRGYEDASIARISFAPSIDKCLLALGYKAEGKTFNVYEPNNYRDLQIIPNDELVKNEYIPDAKFTGEVWVTSPVTLKLLFKIEALGPKDKYEEFSYGNETQKTWYWNWRILDEN